MANVIYLGGKVSGGSMQLSVRFYAGRACDQRTLSRIFVPAALWDEVSHSLLKPRRFATEDTLSAADARRDMEALRSYIIDGYTAAHGRVGDSFLKECVARFWGDAVPGSERADRPLSECFPLYCDSVSMSPGTRRRYDVVVHDLERFALSHHTLMAGGVSPADIEEFSAFLSGELKPDGSAPVRGGNTINSRLRAVRAVCRWCVRQGIAGESPFGVGSYKIKADVYGTPTFLTIAERDAVYSCQMPTRKLEEQRDVFVFQCLVGCRVSDLLTLTAANVSADGSTLNYVPVKTSGSRPVTVSVPLTPTAREILERYRGRPDGRLLPFVWSQDYNDTIKIVLAIAGVTRVVFVHNAVSRKDEPRRLCDIASSHLARRTFMANMFKLTGSERITSAMTGHVEHSRAFSRYVVVDDELKKDAIRGLDGRSDFTPT